MRGVTNSMTCPECGMNLKNGKCPVCGYEVAISKKIKSDMNNKKYCKHCGEIIDNKCIVCPKCGKQVEELKASDRNIIINNSSSASASASANAYIPAYRGKLCNKWTSFFLCLFLGIFGAHKFYEGKTGMGILYLFTLGLCFVGWVIDIFKILSKPNPDYA